MASMLRRKAISAFVLGLAVLCLGAAVPAAPAAEAATLLAHNVYFSLKDKSPAAQDKLVAACQKYLKNHQGVAFFAAGKVASELDREVNQRDFEVSLHVFFRSKADHDRYQTHPEHLKFIEENQSNWAKVRVFDSYVK